MPWSLILKILEKIAVAVVNKLESDPQLASNIADQLLAFVLSKLKALNG